MLSDVMLFSGVKIVFRVGLVLLKCMLGSQEKLKACQGLYETMELLRAIQPQYMQEGFLVHEVQLYMIRVIHFTVLAQRLARSAVFLFDFALDLTCYVLEYLHQKPQALLTCDSRSFSPCVSDY